MGHPSNAVESPGNNGSPEPLDRDAILSEKFGDKGLARIKDASNDLGPATAAVSENLLNLATKKE